MTEVGEKKIDVIVVEDDGDSRLMLETLLTTHGFVVRACATPHAGRTLVDAQVPDVAVIDLNLIHGAGGWAFAQCIRDDPRTSSVALIAVTGEIEPRLEVVRAFDAYLRKPVETDLLVRLARQLHAISRAGHGRMRATG